MSRYLTAMTASYVAMGGVAFCLAYVAVMLPESLSQQSRLEVNAVHDVPAVRLSTSSPQWRGGTELILASVTRFREVQ